MFVATVCSYDLRLIHSHRVDVMVMSTFFFKGAQRLITGLLPLLKSKSLFVLEVRAKFEMGHFVFVICPPN